MKKIFLSLLALIVLPFVAKSQVVEAGDIYKIYTHPVVYNFDEQVSWYFDLTGTTFAEDEDVYIWIWSPSEPDAGNWENSSDFAKLTYVGNMVWRFDLTPTEYFGKTTEEIANSDGFWLRLKDKNGTKQSGVSNVAVTDFSEFAGSGEDFKFYPEQFYIDKPLSILFNSNNIECFAGANSVHMHSGLNNWEVLQEYQAWLPEIVEKVKLKDMGAGIYKMDLIPEEYYNTPEGYVMTTMNFLFVKDEWACTTPDFIMYAPDVPVPPDPVLSIFPLKVSVKDFLIIERKHNSPGQKLKYQVTGGTKTIEGDFVGNMDLQKGYVNLNGEFGDMALDKISVKIIDTNSNVIYQDDIAIISKDN